jgi:hypothetical protein
MIRAVNGISLEKINFMNFKRMAFPPKDVTFSEVRGQFLEDVKQFAVTCSESDIEQLRLEILWSALRERAFGPAEAIACNSSPVQRPVMHH